MVILGMSCVCPPVLHHYHGDNVGGGEMMSVVLNPEAQLT